MLLMLTPLSMGPIAASIAAHDGDAEIIAVFERCFYLAAPAGIICVGVPALGDGPLNLLLATDHTAPDWARVGITRDAKCVIRARSLFIGADGALPFIGAKLWQPPPWPTARVAHPVAALAAVRAAAASQCPAEGLSALVFAPGRANDRAAEAAAPLVATLQTALPDAIKHGRADADLIRAATLLIGLGPGLTPSGDDLLGGIFLALSATSRESLRDDLWAALEPELDLLTVVISAAHLAAAADGMASASVHAALNAILVNDHMHAPAHVAAFASIGQTSGFDTLAGLVLALEAFQ
jgi:hypothetical protein